jgi:acyl transferase domain-containing protein
MLKHSSRRDAWEAATGVYVGIQQMEYSGLAARYMGISPFTATGASFSVAAGRLSYTYGLTGKHQL